MDTGANFDDCKEIMDKFKTIEYNFESYNRQYEGNKNFKTLYQKSYGLHRNELMNFFCELIQKNPVNISRILRINLDFKCWNLLVERIAKTLNVQ